MAFQQVFLDRKAIDVALSMSGTQLAVLSDTGVAVYALDLRKRPVPLPSLLWQSNALEGYCSRHVSFMGDGRICVLADIWDEDESFIWTSEGQELVEKGPILEGGKVSSLTTSVDYEKLYVTFQNGSLHELLIGEDSSHLPMQTPLVTSLPSFSQEVKTIILEGQVSVYC